MSQHRVTRLENVCQVLRVVARNDLYSNVKNAIEAAMLDVELLISEVNSINEKLNSDEKVPDFDSYNELLSVVLW